MEEEEEEVNYDCKYWVKFSIEWVIKKVKNFTWKTWLTIILIILFFILLFTFILFLPWGEWLGDFLEWVESLGIWGPILLAEMYIFCTILMIPGSILTIGAGFVFQSVLVATVSVSIGSTTGCFAAFLYGNTFMRKWVKNKIAPYEVFNALDDAIAEKGWLVVLLLRLSPVIPYNLINYGLGITKVGLIEYTFFSWLGMIPATIVYSYIGTTISDIAVIISGDISPDPLTITLFVLGLVATVVVLIVISYLAKKKIQQVINEAIAKRKTNENLLLEEEIDQNDEQFYDMNFN